MLETSLHLLIIEDDDNHYQLIRRHLRRAAAGAISFDRVATLQAGLESLSSDVTFDAILTDLNLPDSRGLETFRDVQNRAGSTPLIALTSQSVTEDGMALMREGAHDYLPKSKLDSELLMRSVLCAVERQRLTRAERTLYQQAGQMEIARNIQMSILPDQFPTWPELAVAASSVPAAEVGGDYYDFITLNDGSYLVAIGDATGHGPGAALIMAMAAASLRTLTAIYTDLGEILTQLNRLLFNETPDFAFMTCCLIRFCRKNSKIRWANAGHLSPVIVSSDGAEKSLLDTADDHLPLGLSSSVVYEESELPVREGDFIYTVTDGITEARNCEQELFGTERLSALLEANREGELGTLLAEISEAVAAWRNGEEAEDDETSVLMRWNG